MVNRSAHVFFFYLIIIIYPNGIYWAAYMTLQMLVYHPVLNNIFIVLNFFIFEF